MRRLATAIILASMLIPSAAFAQQDSQQTQKTKTYTFVPEKIDGTVVGPEGTNVTADPGTHAPKHLIHLRRNFRMKLIKSVDAL